VRTQVGQTALTLIPSGEWSRPASTCQYLWKDSTWVGNYSPAILVIPIDACFEMVYDPFPGRPANELAEATFTMTPRPISRVPFLLFQVLGSCLSIAATWARTQSRLPRVLMFMIRSKFSISVSARGAWTPLSTYVREF
jgi:hypothetical protein